MEASVAHFLGATSNEHIEQVYVDFVALQRRDVHINLMDKAPPIR